MERACARRLPHSPAHGPQQLAVRDGRQHEALLAAVERARGLLVDKRAKGGAAVHARGCDCGTGGGTGWARWRGGRGGARHDGCGRGRGGVGRSAPYEWPCSNGGAVVSSSSPSSVWPWLLLIESAHALVSGSCLRMMPTARPFFAIEKRQRAMTWKVSGASSRSSLTRIEFQRSAHTSTRRFLTRPATLSMFRPRGLRPASLRTPVRQ